VTLAHRLNAPTSERTLAFSISVIRRCLLTTISVVLTQPCSYQVARAISLMRVVRRASIHAFGLGSGTFGMEAVGRCFGTDKKCMVIRNGYFSYRWSDIFHVCEIPSSEVVRIATQARLLGHERNNCARLGRLECSPGARSREREVSTD
jgi:hypothetical protein